MRSLSCSKKTEVCGCTFVSFFLPCLSGSLLFFACVGPCFLDFLKYCVHDTLLSCALDVLVSCFLVFFFSCFSSRAFVLPGVLVFLPSCVLAFFLGSLAPLLACSLARLLACVLDFLLFLCHQTRSFPTPCFFSHFLVLVLARRCFKGIPERIADIEGMNGR